MEMVKMMMMMMMAFYYSPQSSALALPSAIHTFLLPQKTSTRKKKMRS